jgi:hypothetical protein
MKTYSYSDIASDYRLWIKYVDTIGIDPKEMFDRQTLEEKIAFMVKCFGPEEAE